MPEKEAEDWREGVEEVMRQEDPMIPFICCHRKKKLLLKKKTKRG